MRASAVHGGQSITLALLPSPFMTLVISGELAGPHRVRGTGRRQLTD
jgi:hypothetical protein